MKTVAVVQARMGSSRLPGKVLKDVGGRPMIQFLLERLARAQTVDAIVLATSASASSDSLAEFVQGLGFDVYRGSEDDVLDRTYQAGLAAKATTVIRITGDCPFVDPALVDEAVAAFASGDVDYLSNVAPPSYPDGLDIEVLCRP